MENNIPQFMSIKNATAEVGLTDNERAAIRSRLGSFMSLIPTITKPTTKAGYWSKIMASKFGLALASIAVFFLGAGGVAYASASALPGDHLYNFHIHVVEEVQSRLNFKADDRAKFEAQRYARRLDEAEQLQKQQRLMVGSQTLIGTEIKAAKFRATTHLVKLVEQHSTTVKDIQIILTEAEASHKLILDLVK